MIRKYKKRLILYILFNFNHLLYVHRLKFQESTSSEL